MIRNAVLSKALIVFTLHFCLLSQAAAAEAGWEAEWERTVKAAEQEGQVTVYKIAHDAEWHAFQKQYPKIKVNLVPASAAQIQQRILAERRAGKFLADVVRLGGGTSTSLYKAKALDPIGPALILSEVKDASNCLRGLSLAFTRLQSKISRPENVDELLGSPRPQVER
ncbi:MAG: extracellular solute-binding protein [Deltaproteobacteria bacterium]|nr:MAG: extracellular solute-binding protein [Deltaproteobacteria bacterium]